MLCITCVDFMDKNVKHAILIRALKGGQETALRQLFDLYADDIYHVAYSVLKDPFESEDIVQEVLIKVWNSRFQLDETGNIWSFVYVVVKRLSLNRLRDLHMMTKKQVALPDTDFASALEADNGTLVQEILTLENEVLEKLPEQQKMAYLLSRSEGLTYKEIAGQMDIAPNTVKNHIIQALKTFREHFQRFGYPLLLIFLHI